MLITRLTIDMNVKTISLLDTEQFSSHGNEFNVSRMSLTRSFNVESVSVSLSPSCSVSRSVYFSASILLFFARLRYNTVYEVIFVMLFFKISQQNANITSTACLLLYHRHLEMHFENCVQAHSS